MVLIWRKSPLLLRKPRGIAPVDSIPYGGVLTRSVAAATRGSKSGPRRLPLARTTASSRRLALPGSPPHPAPSVFAAQRQDVEVCRFRSPVRTRPSHERRTGGVGAVGRCGRFQIDGFALSPGLRVHSARHAGCAGCGAQSNETLARRCWLARHRGARSACLPRLPPSSARRHSIIAVRHSRGRPIYVPLPQIGSRVQGWLVLRTNFYAGSLNHCAQRRRATDRRSKPLPMPLWRRCRGWPPARWSHEVSFWRRLLGGFALDRRGAALVGVYGLLSFSVAAASSDNRVRIALRARAARPRRSRGFPPDDGRVHLDRRGRVGWRALSRCSGMARSSALRRTTR